MVSVIIPVYNSEKYIRNCVDSVLKQSYQEIEIILVDDESKDSSPQICDEYANKDKRVKVIHKKNGGTADARNTGLTAATGEYITFMDNDDYWNDEDALRNIMEQLNETKADVLMFDTMEYWENKHKFARSSKSCERSKVAFQNRDNALREIIQNGLLYRAVWAKVIKAQLIREHGLYFENGIRNEDTDWTAKLLLCAETYDWYEGVFYVYRKGTGQAQTDVRVSDKEVKDLKYILTKYIDVGKKEEDLEFQKLFYSYLAYPFAVLMGQIRIIGNKQYENDIKKDAFILDYDFDPSVKIVKKVYHILGYNLTAILLKQYLLR